MAKYRKIDVRIWNDEKFSSLSDLGQLAFIFVLTHPLMTSLGALRGSPEGLSGERYGWTDSAKALRKGFQEGFDEVLSKGLLRYDERGMIFAPNFIKYNSPESPNVIKAWRNALDLLPECALLNEALKSAKNSVDAMSEAYRKAFREAFPEVFSKDFAKAMPNQEQEQEQELLSASSSTRENKSEKVSKPKKEKKAVDFYGVPDSVRDDWLALRKAKRAVVSQNVVDDLKAKATKLGWSLEQVMKTMVSRNWQGFEISWLDNQPIKADPTQDQFRVKKPVYGSKTPEGICTPWNAPDEASEDVLKALGDGR